VSFSDLPTLNACLNSVSSVLLIYGFVLIRKGLREKHRRVMLSALGTSMLFLISYVVYHYSVGSIPYPYHDWTRPLYFTILIPHVILAVAMVPFIIAGLWWALTDRFDKHRKLMRYVWPVWMFVSVTGVTVYLMLYRL
jgi:uncharacterized membrane protein YozB (DUF420 family)